MSPAEVEGREWPLTGEAYFSHCFWKEGSGLFLFLFCGRMLRGSLLISAVFSMNR